MNVSRHIWLIVLWLLFGFLHSFFAANSFKQIMQPLLKKFYKYYRPVYSLIAAVTLGIVVWYHFKINSSLLWKPFLVEEGLAIILMLLGLIAMLITGSKYFLHLTGIDVFIKQNPSNNLQQKGLHKCMRHPLYSATLLFVWAYFFWHPYLNNLISCVCITLYVRIGIYFEEKKLIKEFGDTYKKYKLSVPMLIPKFYKYLS